MLGWGGRLRPREMAPMSRQPKLFVREQGHELLVSSSSKNLNLPAMSNYRTGAPSGSPNYCIRPLPPTANHRHNAEQLTRVPNEYPSGGPAD